MTGTGVRRSALVGIAAAMLLLVAPWGGAVGSDVEAIHPVEGRFSVTSDAGGAVWAFQAGGSLIVVGPGEIVSEGSWLPGGAEREFDAALDVEVTGQRLMVLGEVSPDGSNVAMYIAASKAADPTGWTPWPADSRLVGKRLGMLPDETPMPSMSPQDCVRPEWVEGVIDWDRCDAERKTPT